MKQYEQATKRWKQERKTEMFTLPWQQRKEEEDGYTAIATFFATFPWNWLYSESCI